MRFFKNYLFQIDGVVMLLDFLMLGKALKGK